VTSNDTERIARLLQQLIEGRIGSGGVRVSASAVLRTCYENRIGTSRCMLVHIDGVVYCVHWGWRLSPGTWSRGTGDWVGHLTGGHMTYLHFRECFVLESDSWTMYVQHLSIWVW